ncbi:hypothetical protein [Pontibacter sp. G13]|uniref:hypothetical protein n=1 Tax=Pontibacter sp. G13 TaxID=3074898 RepID=UPI00288BDA60|nr:hypothetical protein [Pontibacter sp. G13]WNJ19734.1 hypothetical protein RJD25_04560 [Pontibacter sp. G13]
MLPTFPLLKRIGHWISLGLWAILVSSLTSCQTPTSYTYEVLPLEIPAPQSEKTKLKTTEQYISVLYTDLFQKALSPQDMSQLRQLIQSVGDKDVIHEIILSNFLNRPDVIIPTRTDMEADIDDFLEDTYHRFYIRPPTEAERNYLRNHIVSHPELTPELVYISFALSDEYQYY